MKNNFWLHAIVHLYGDRATDHVELFENYESEEAAHAAKEKVTSAIKNAIDKVESVPKCTPTIVICGGIFRPEEIRYAKLWVAEAPSSESGGDGE